MGIVHLSLFVVVEDLIGLFRRLESDLGFDALFFDDFVGVMLKCSLAACQSLKCKVTPLACGGPDLVIGFLDFGFGGTAGDPEDLCIS